MGEPRAYTSDAELRCAAERGAAAGRNPCEAATRASRKGKHGEPPGHMKMAAAGPDSEGKRNQNILSLAVVSISVLGVYIYFKSSTNSTRREAELTKVIHSYEESVFL